MNRRNFLGLLGASVLIPATVASRPVGRSPDLRVALSRLERRAAGRLGVAILDTGTGEISGQRLDERFAMCSTFKLLLAGAVLEAADAGRASLEQPIAYGERDLVANSPVSRANLSRGSMTMGELAHATQTTSDNAAANLLLARLGGPQGLTATLRRWKDPATRIDRIEPEMNLVAPGDPRDTTTPRAMAMTVSRLLTGNILKPASRDQLIGWMEETRTGLRRIRAGLPADWRAGDKTGTGWGNEVTDKYNDVAIAWPPERAPVVIACYYDTPRRSQSMRDEDQAVLAEVGRLAAAWTLASNPGGHRRNPATFSLQ